MQPGATTLVHEPFSRSLGRMLERDSGHLTANRVIEGTDGRGLYLVLIIFSLPFVAWVSVPGMSTVLGPMIGILALRLALGKQPRLPKFLGDRVLPPKLKHAILTGGMKFCRLLEKVVRPRRTAWMSWRLARLGNALLIVFMAFLLALPLPSPPFLGSNALPSYGIILLAVSMMEEDGVMIWFGYLASIIASLYFVIFGALIVKHLGAWLHVTLHWLRMTQ
jgi:hypothetical protein